MILHLENEQFEAHGEYFLFTGEVEVIRNDEPAGHFIVYIYSAFVWRQDTSMENWGEWVIYLPFVRHIESLAINHYENRQFRGTIQPHNIKNCPF